MKEDDEHTEDDKERIRFQKPNGPLTQSKKILIDGDFMQGRHFSTIAQSKLTPQYATFCSIEYVYPTLHNSRLLVAGFLFIKLFVLLILFK